MSLDAAFDLAQQLTPRLLPLIPYLVKGAKKVKEAILDRLSTQKGRDAFETAEKIWKKLKPKLDEQPATRESVEKVAEQPSDPKNTETLAKALESALGDEALRKSVVSLLDVSRKKGVTLASYVKVGQVCARVCGIEIENVKDLQAEKVVARVIAGDVKKGGEVVGMRIGATSPPPRFPGNPTTDTPRPKGRKSKSNRST